MLIDNEWKFFKRCADEPREVKAENVVESLYDEKIYARLGEVEQANEESLCFVRKLF